MTPERDHLHAHFGTRQPLLAEARFMELVRRAESFNGGSPFTLCRASSLSKGDMNLTEGVRKQLSEGRWLPEAGLAELVVLAPANGRWFSVGMQLPVNPELISHVHYRFERSYGSDSGLDDLVAFFEQTAVELDAEFGYFHEALDEAIQDTTDPRRLRALTGRAPDGDPLDPETRPGRSLRAGRYFLTCRWLSYFGGELADRIGKERLETAPCERKRLGDGVLLRLYHDPYSAALPDNRQTQAGVRRHLRIDELVEDAQLTASPAEREAEAPPLEKAPAEPVAPEPAPTGPAAAARAPATEAAPVSTTAESGPPAPRFTDPRHRFTASDVRRMVEAGVLDEDAPRELLEGDLIVVSSQGPSHPALVGITHRTLLRHYGDDVCVLGQGPLNVSPHSQPEPDLMVLRGSARDYLEKLPTGADAVLVIEIAVTSQNRDRAKAVLYSRAGVPVYWLVDVEARQLEVREGPRPDGDYQRTTILREGATVGLPGVDDEIAVADILP
jgi:Uma2 family endonuclease